jgi:class 3 adenylate cyclase
LTWREHYRIAYQVTGHGAIDMVWAPGTTSHLDLAWEWPAMVRGIERIGTFCRLIRFDKRGTGLSDRPAGVATLEERTDDIRAVMDAAGSETATICGVSEGASMACVFAAMYPERTRSLILYGAQARWVSTDDYPWGLTPLQHAEFVHHVREKWPSREYVTGWGAGLGRHVDPAFLEWWLRYARAAASPSAAAALEQMNGEIDTRDILPAIRVPTLVMHRTGDPVAHIDAGRDLARRVAGARFVEFPGEVHSWSGIEQQVLDEIEEFVTGTRPPVMTDRFLTTVLFVDIVNSTQRAAAIGDVAWRDLLTAFYTAVRRELVRFRGVERDTAGDGMLATFDGPARGIRCAMAIRKAVRSLGIDVRSGLHTGECEAMGDKISGIAVHIGARVSAVAAPGEIIVSSTVKDLVAGSGLEFTDRGPHALRGIAGEWRLFVAEETGTA